MNQKKKNINEIVEFSSLDVPVFGNLSEMLEEIKPDCVVDFTTPKVGYSNTKTILEHGVRAVVGTTGFTPEQISELRSIAESKKNRCVNCAKLCCRRCFNDAICTKSS